MTDTLGTLLKQMRQTRQLSLRELARLSSVSQPALGWWEQGRHQPRLPELEAALLALGATPAQRKQAMALLDAPRARRQAQEVATQAEIGEMPGSGDLLRAMRLRRKMTLEQAAAPLGVRASTLSRWERGDAWPSAEMVQSLCRLLHASGEESAALAGGPSGFALSGPATVTTDALEAQLKTLWHTGTALRDLGLIGIEARLWKMAGEQRGAWNLLLKTYALHGLYLSDRKRYAEAAVYLDRSQEMTASRRARDADWLPSVIVSGRVAAYSGKSRKPGQGIELLRGWLDEVKDAEYRAWILSDIAEYLALEGCFAEAVTLGAQSCRAIEAHNDIEWRFRRRDLAGLLVRAGRPHEALETLSDCAFVGMGPEYVARDSLLRVEAFLACGDNSGASLYLTEAENSIALHHLEYLRPQVAALAQQL